ncbi:zinc-dependent alcohol dehydrogenase family protein [Alphaproteobacteria bacterium]|nr:zinc-dependent alcohol dehydrogenase family protein [Alphaproteobacteria bacterium]
MSIKCKAAVIRTNKATAPYKVSQPLTIEEINISPPQANEILVQVKGAGLCHSDLSVINGSRVMPMPLVIGHEGSGEVVELGNAVNDIKIGDHVSFQFSPSCGRCRRCLEGRPQVCELAAATKGKGQLMSGGSRLTDANGEVLNHHTGVSCMSEYAVVDRGSVVVIDKSINIEDAALFGCAVMTGVGAVINTARIRPGDSVAIIGLGGVGLNGIMGAKLGGAETIIAIDIDPSKFSRAKELGATHCFDSRNNDVIEEIRDLTNGGVDFAIDLAGVIPAMNTAYQIIRYGGSVVTAGLSPINTQFSFNHSDLVAQEKSILGSYMGSCVPVRDVPRFLSLFQQGRLPVEKLIDGKIGFDDLNEGFDKLAKGEVIRQILLPGR